jgi:hypothetical protein
MRDCTEFFNDDSIVSNYGASSYLAWLRLGEHQMRLGLRMEQSLEMRQNIAQKFNRLLSF